MNDSEYVTAIGTPPVGTGKARPPKARWTHATTPASLMREPASLTVPTAPSASMTKRVRTEPARVGSVRRPFS